MSFKVVESVTQGNPDKICDQIADAIVDEYLRRDPASKVDVNVVGSHGMLMITGEVNSRADFDIAELAKGVYQEIGYTDDLEVFVNVESSSSEMQHALSSPMDTVVVSGYATRETREFMPRPVVFAHTIARRLDDLRRTDPSFSWLCPDGKVQLMMEHDRVHAVTVLAAHASFKQVHEVQQAILARLIEPLVGGEAVEIHINPLGSFTIHGFHADSGVSGHKLGVDAYGGLVPHTDCALSGKDPLKAERAGSYLARVAARYIVEQELASSVLVKAAYTIGKAQPIHLEAFGMSNSSRGSKLDFSALISQKFDWRPEAIVERLGLNKISLRQTAVYGHFGRAGFPWETSLASS